MHTEASLAYGCPDEEILRELASYDMRSPDCVTLVKDQLGYNLFEIPRSIASFHWSRQYEYAWAILNSNLKKTDICLDAGGGFSSFKYALATRTEKVISIDLDLESIGKSIITTRKLGFNNIEHYKYSIDEYQPDFKFDKIYCLSVLEHISSPEIRLKCMANLLRLLKPDGILLMTLDIVVSVGKYSYDFYIDKDHAYEMLSWFGVKDFSFENAMFYEFPSGCKLNVLCLKVYN